MERYSTWRDPATGIAAFVYPKPPAGQSSPLAVLATPLLWALALVRIAALVVILSIKLLLIDVALLFTHVPSIHHPVSHTINAITCRLMLIFFGFYWITAEQSRPKAKIKVAARSTGAKALVIANWSSPFDVLYLVGRYNVDKFLLPVVENKAADPSPKQGMKVARVQVIGVRSVGFFRAMMATGYPPAVAQPGRKYLSLEQGFDTARTAAAVFPEGTSSNNRGLLRFADIPLGTRPRASLRIVSLRYDTPAPLKPSATLPSPTFLNPLSHLIRHTASPLPHGLLVRTLPEADAPSLSGKGGSAEFWEQCATSLATLGRWKRLPSLGLEEKWGFLSYQAKR